MDSSWWDDLNDGVKAIIGFFILLIVVTALYLGYYRAFAPQFADAERDVYEHSRSYVEGSVRDLNNLCIEVAKANPTHKDLLNDTIRHRYVKLDPADVPDYLRPCLTAARIGGN